MSNLPLSAKYHIIVSSMDVTIGGDDDLKILFTFKDANSTWFALYTFDDIPLEQKPPSAEGEGQVYKTTYLAKQKQSSFNVSPPIAIDEFGGSARIVLINKPKTPKSMSGHMLLKPVGRSLMHIFFDATPLVKIRDLDRWGFLNKEIVNNSNQR